MKSKRALVTLRRCTLRDMTVCIAACLPVLNTIVCVSDTKLSNEGLAADGGTFKSSPLTHDASWWAMYTGYPTEFQALVRRIKRALGDATSVSLDDVLRAAEAAYREELVRIGDMRFLAPLGFTRAEFFAQRDAIGESAYAGLFQSLASVRLETELMFCGFDSEGPHVASIGSDGVYQIHDTIGFHAIGEGAWLALGSLYLSPRFMFDPFESVIYHLYGAKLAAERAPTVGNETLMTTSSRSNSLRRAVTRA